MQFNFTFPHEDSSSCRLLFTFLDRAIRGDEDALRVLEGYWMLDEMLSRDDVFADLASAVKRVIERLRNEQ